MKNLKKTFIAILIIFCFFLTACSSVSTVVGTTWHHDFVGCTVDFAEDYSLTLYSIRTTSGVYNGETVVDTTIYLHEGTYVWNDDDETGEFYFNTDSDVGMSGTIYIVDEGIVMENTEGTYYTFMEQAEIPEGEYIMAE